MYLLLAGLMACTPTPEVGALDPSTVDPGQTVRVIGRAFTPEATVNLVSYSGESTGLAQINVASENIIEVTVPDGVTSGTYGVRISQGSKTAELVPELPSVQHRASCCVGNNVRFPSFPKYVRKSQSNGLTQPEIPSASSQSYRLRRLSGLNIPWFRFRAGAVKSFD